MTDHPTSAPAEPAPRGKPLRGYPTQARSRQTFEAILAAAADLLDEVGWDGFNTNALAERAGYRVSAVYRYFPDKLAIVTTLADSLVAEWDRELADFGTAVAHVGDIRPVWAQYLEKFRTIVNAKPGAIAIRRAMQASPELRAIDQADNRRLAALLSKVLQTQIPGLAPQRAETVSQLLIETAVPILDLAQEASAEEAARLLNELNTLHTAYFDQLGAPAPKTR